jgi:3-hydroxyacyl-[acyl-carrier-protein] dehydratase
MLADDFYFLTDVLHRDDTILATLSLNPGHRIFEGHFPGQPVVPGVCMMQIMKELLEREKGIRIRLLDSEFAKFLSLINPRERPLVQAEIKYEMSPDGEISITARMFWENITFLKYKARFAIQIPPLPEHDDGP